jgi:hypothetical protein
MSAKISENIYKPFHAEHESILKQVENIAHSGLIDCNPNAIQAGSKTAVERSAWL